jgi:hypothetical protein
MKAHPLLHDSSVEIPVDRYQSQKANRPLGEHHWEIHTCRTLEQIKLVRPIWKRLRGETDFCVDIEVDFDRYISVLEFTPECEPYTLLVFRDGAPRAMLIGTKGPVTINCKLGYLKVLRVTLKCLTIIHGGYLGDFCEQTSRRLLDHLYTSLCEDQTDVVIFRQLPLASPLYSLATKRSPIFCRRHFPKIDRHWRMAIPDRIDSFYKQHSAKTRQTLKRQLKQLDTKFQTRLIECTDPEMVSMTLHDAAAVSSRTYQHALGSGLLDDANTRKLLFTAAQNGWLCLHVLYLNEQPCAFQLGLRYHGMYFLQTMGFDPAKKQRNLGTALFLKVLDQLCQDPAVKYLDFGFGDAEYKRRFGTEYWDEAAVYLFAPKAYPMLINVIHTTVSDVSEGLRVLARKSGFEGKIKRKWRTLLQRTHCSKQN